MKTLIKTLALSVMFSTCTYFPVKNAKPSPARADYAWQCVPETTCNAFGCWTRVKCCEQVWNPYTGAYVWRCWYK